MLKNLFLDGFTLDNFINIASKEEREKFFETEKNIIFSDELVKKIIAVNEDIHIVASVETWCPYARVFSAAIKKLNELNPKFKLSFITMGRGMMDIADILNIDEDDYVVPTALILDKNFNLLKSFIGFPKKYSETGLGKNITAYFNGLKADEIVDEIL